MAPQPTHPAVHAPGDYELAEGARWVDGRPVFVDIPTGRLFELPPDSPHTPRELLRLDVPLGAVAPLADRPGHWIAAAGTGIALLTPHGLVRWLARPEDGSPFPVRMNDGVCDPAGRFWAGSMSEGGAVPGAGSLYRTDPDGSVHRVLGGLTVANGPAFNADATVLYLADSALGTVHRLTLDPDGEPTGNEEFTRLATGSPDGMTVDTEGCLWVAVWDGAAVHRYHPDGALLDTLRLPTPRPTSVCLRPEGGLLLVTTARHGLSGDAGPAGSILAVPVDAAAPPAAAFRLH
ncbi:SMP-30/gluconolactonase/LRE family protein [Kitasatospora sp. NA04385]|uniref:SMP-30/gluconolactonase/LRE family protein n=1 Tax=Kitasatospora sp. NA04385 TaxID=2742135 RepID=UPI001591EEF4|nr:SMP-30/gluconolactonase/LRE family protein [Kitasatospora sp. NA04385]QKW17816.1 SMP-30/gluconolactonase/LRE family protein [Kitasatospora sp. NA04385]